MAMAENLNSEREAHINMWKHYDSLRQSKNASFLTTNSILVAIVGLLHGNLDELIFLVSLLGISVCLSWFFLLRRNSDYISYHRIKASENNVELWKPESKSYKSKYYDKVPVVAFGIFWTGVLVVALINYQY